MMRNLDSLWPVWLPLNRVGLFDVSRDEAILHRSVFFVFYVLLPLVLLSLWSSSSSSSSGKRGMGRGQGNGERGMGKGEKAAVVRFADECCAVAEVEEDFVFAIIIDTVVGFHIHDGYFTVDRSLESPFLSFSSSFSSSFFVFHFFIFHFFFSTPLNPLSFGLPPFLGLIWGLRHANITSRTSTPNAILSSKTMMIFLSCVDEECFASVLVFPLSE